MKDPNDQRPTVCGRNLTDDRLRHNTNVYIAIARRADQDLWDAAAQWYLDASDSTRQLAMRYQQRSMFAGLDFSTVWERIILATAALSPSMRWEENIDATESVLVHGPDGAGVMGTNAATAYGCLTGAITTLGDAKTAAFACDILTGGRSGHATMDRWMMRAVGMQESIPSRWYSTVEQTAIDAATLLGVEPAILQALVWIFVRDILHLKPGEYLTFSDTGSLIIAGAPLARCFQRTHAARTAQFNAG